MATLGIDLNQSGLNEVDAPESVAVDGAFTVDLRNHGEPVHVHLRFDEPLASVTSIDATNHFVDGGTTRSVRVETADVDEPVTGRLDVVTGHGAETTPVRVTLRPPAADRRSVEVDESLASPASAETDPNDTAATEAAAKTDETADEDGSLADSFDPGATPDTTTFAVAAFASIVLIAAVVAAVTLQSLVVTLGLVAVLVTIGVAGYLLLG